MNKVFIAEDDEYVSRMYERAFRLRGFEVEVVSSGKIALKRLQEMSQKPSVIITDALLPEMSGKDLIRRIREDTIFRSIPIAVLTNSFSREDADQFLALGADLYLIKIEHDSKSVVEKIHNLIEKHNIHNS